MADQKEIDSARKLAKRLIETLARQTRTVEETRQQLAGIEAYIRGLEKTK